MFNGFYRNIVLNNPQKRNALSLAMLQSLREDLLHDVKSKELRVIIISGTSSFKADGREGRGGEGRSRKGIIRSLTRNLSQNYRKRDGIAWCFPCSGPGPRRGSYRCLHPPEPALFYMLFFYTHPNFHSYVLKSSFLNTALTIDLGFVTSFLIVNMS